MIKGVGIDVVRVSRFEKWAADQKLLDRYFHPGEIACCRERGRSMTQSLAARFAAKEAFGKALGTGLAGLRLKDITVTGGPGGAPVLEARGSALEAMKKRGAEKAHVSLAHEGGTAIAVVILEGAWTKD